MTFGKPGIVDLSRSFQPKRLRLAGKPNHLQSQRIIPSSQEPVQMLFRRAFLFALFTVASLLSAQQTASSKHIFNPQNGPAVTRDKAYSSPITGAVVDASGPSLPEQPCRF
jgi:hypothetical protein